MCFIGKSPSGCGYDDVAVDVDVDEVEELTGGTSASLCLKMGISIRSMS